MKRIFFLPIVLLAILTSSCSHDAIDGSGYITLEIKTL